jgi:hypothetical protein
MASMQWLVVVQLVLVWGSVIIGLLTGWRMPLPRWAAIPAGLAIWFGGLILNLQGRKRFREVMGPGGLKARKRGYPLIAGRTAMNLGIALAFRSWPTLVATALLLAFYLLLAQKVRSSIPWPPRRQAPSRCLR